MMMTIATDSTQIAELGRKIRRGDQFARDELLKTVYSRLTRLVTKMLHEGSAAVNRWEQPEDVLHRAWFRLQRMLEECVIHDGSHFFRLAARQIRFELIDLHRHYTGANGLDANYHSTIPNDSKQLPKTTDWTCSDVTCEPQRLTEWTEFHQAVGKLPELEREVFQMIWYDGLSQADIARLLEIHVRTVKRRLRRARTQLRKQICKLPS